MLKFKQYISESPFPKAHETNVKHKLSHAFVSGATDLWMRETGTPKNLQKVFDDLEQNIKKHYPNWTENKAHEIGMEYLDVLTDLMEEEDDLTPSIMKKLHLQTAKKLHINPDLIKDFAKIEKHYFS